MCTLFRTTENLVNFVWESVDPDRVEENDYLGDMDLQIMEQMQSFQSTASEASKDVDYEYEDGFIRSFRTNCRATATGWAMAPPIFLRY